MNTNLVLFTQEYPFGSGETFLEAELMVLSAHFEHVHIVSFSRDMTKTRNLPEKCSLEHICINQSALRKAKAMFGIFSPITWQEFRIIKNVYRVKVDLAKLKTLLISLSVGREIARKVEQFIKDGFQLENTVFYSYWADDAAIGLALASKNNPRLKAITRVHGWDLYFERSACHYLPFRQLLAKQLSGIYSISELGVRYMQDVWKIPPKNLRLTRLGVCAQEKLEKNEVFTLFSCSSVIPLKRVELIAKAVVEYGNQWPIRWVHIGDGPEMNSLRKIVQNRNAQTEVELLGHLSNSEVMDAYRTFKPWVFVNVSETEGVPVSIMEALSFGVPVIATNVGGTHELVTEKNGHLLSQNIESFALSAVLNHFAHTDQAKWDEYSTEAAETWRRMCNSQQNYSDFASLLINLSR